MKRILFAILMVMTIFVNAQEEDQKPEFTHEKNSYITFDISTPVNFVSPRYRFGYIQSINRKWRIGADIGYGSEQISVKGFVNSSEQDNYELLEGRVEVYHLLNPTKKVTMYLSGEVYYIYHTETYFNDYFETDNDYRNTYFDRADFARNKYGFNLKFGVMVPFGNRAGINAYIGAGPRIRDNQFTNIVNPGLADYEDEFYFDFFEYNFKKEGTSLGFNFALGLKFFFRIQ